MFLVALSQAIGKHVKRTNIECCAKTRVSRLIEASSTYVPGRVVIEASFSWWFVFVCLLLVKPIRKSTGPEIAAELQ